VQQAQALKIPNKIFFRIGEVAGMLGIQPHVIRYWETEFAQLKPKKTHTQQRRYSRPAVFRVALVQYLLHNKGLSVANARTKISQYDTSDKGIERQISLLKGLKNPNILAHNDNPEPSPAVQNTVSNSTALNKAANSDVASSTPGSFLHERQKLQEELDQTKASCQKLRKENADLQERMKRYEDAMKRMEKLSLGGVQKIKVILDERSREG
jgi:DNA-binding transcriptional MerR regulator